MRKKVLLIVVDACAARVLCPALELGRLPTLRALADAGTLSLDCSAIFPSITPAATASIITGCYPCDHAIAGDYWYDIDSNTIAYFGADFRVIWKKGLGAFFDDFLVKLNHTMLSADTLFQTVERAGLRAACINYLVFRGDTPHQVDVPRLLSLIPDIAPTEEVYGPSLLRLGDFVGPDLRDVDVALRSSGPLHRYGFEDQHTAQDLLKMAKHGALPNLTVAYFPDNDFDSHAKGPAAAVTTLEQVDTYLGQFLDICGGLEATLQEFCLVLTGDHSQSDMLADSTVAGIDLDQVLADFDIAEVGTPWSNDEQLVICPNMRLAHIYFRQPTREQISRVITQLVTEPRIDQVLWRADLVGEAGEGYYVITRDRGRLHFWPGSDGSHTALDQQACAWSWEGDLRTVDGQVSSDGVIMFPTYPNAFERIACALRVRCGGHVWVTAHPGHEFRLPGINVHAAGGSHGSLHQLDSTVPLLLAGAPADIILPPHPCTVDVAPLCLAILGIEPNLPPGASHL